VVRGRRCASGPGSLTLARGMHVEQAAIMAALSSPAAARGIKAYVDQVTETGDLPAFDRDARKPWTEGIEVDVMM
jgi:acetaldehyde dehydrogenase (acetylating)